VQEAALIPSRPALAGWCRVVPDGSRLLLEHGGSLVTLEGRAVQALLPSLLPLLDGTRTREEIALALGPPVEPAVVRALALLARHGLLVDGEPCEPDGTPRTAAASYVAAVTRRTSVTDASAVLAQAAVVVLGSGVAADAAAGQLRHTGFVRVERRPIDGPADADALVVASPCSDEVEELESVNRRRLEDGGAWIQLLPYDGRHLVVGPLFLPGASACRGCYVARRAACSGYEEDFDRVEAVPPRAAAPPPLAAAGAALAAVLALRWCTVRDPTLPGCLYALEPGPVLRLSHHRVLRVPRCRACIPQRAVPSPWHQGAWE
jgi:bacteriocin biosynthesis cyclodehydratase domain-containing protein